MTNLISFPFRFAEDGSVAVHDDASDDYYSEEIAAMLLTRPGEREMVPDFGVEDQAYAEFDFDELQTKLSLFNVPVVLDQVTGGAISDEYTELDITFDREDELYSLDEDDEDDDEESFGSPNSTDYSDSLNAFEE